MSALLEQTDYSYEGLKSLSAYALRMLIREKAYTHHTAGLATGCLQANLVILPEAHALDFMRYCHRNPKPCPLIWVSDTGNPHIHALGVDLDIRSDLSAYNIYRDGKLSQEAHEIYDFWQDDFVCFALGCSFTFEHALMRAGIPIWHIDNNKTVPMYKTSIKTTKAGIFAGDMVVSMRMIKPAMLDEVIKICRNFPLAHGTPIYHGNPSKIGIKDLNKPDWGDTPLIEEDKIPVFWGCGVTPQVALEGAELPISITHKPGHMLITDIAEDAEFPTNIRI